MATMPGTPVAYVHAPSAATGAAGVGAAAGAVREMPVPAGSSQAPRERRSNEVRGENRSNEVLVARYQLSHDAACLDLLLERNANLLHFVLKRFQRSDEPYEDLYQVARLGLIKAAQRFDPGAGATFATYAVAIADGEVRHYLRDSLLMRQPRWARALYKRIQEAQNEFHRTQHRSASIAEIAEAVNVREEGVLEILRVCGAGAIASYDEAISGGSDDAPKLELLRSLRSETFSLPLEDKILLYEALNGLSDLHRKIIYLLFFRDLTQQEVAAETGLTQRTVSREQSKALARLKAVLGKKIF